MFAIIWPRPCDWSVPGGDQLPHIYREARRQEKKKIHTLLEHDNRGGLSAEGHFLGTHRAQLQAGKGR